MPSTEDSAHSRNEYIGRINRVLEYVLDHLDDDLSLATLSGVACFSPWHFHRIFTAFMEETPDDYVRRLRLEKAASRLIQRRDLDVTEIGHLCGFSTSALFSRNFRKYYGLSPSEFRSRGVSGETQSKKRQTVDKDGQHESNNVKAPISLERYYRHRNEDVLGLDGDFLVTVKKIDPIFVAYQWHTRGYFYGVDDSIGRMRKWAKVRDLLSDDTRIIGIGFDNPSITPVLSFFSVLAYRKNK